MSQEPSVAYNRKLFSYSVLRADVCFTQNVNCTVICVCAYRSRRGVVCYYDYVRAVSGRYIDTRRTVGIRRIIRPRRLSPLLYLLLYLCVPLLS